MNGSEESSGTQALAALIRAADYPLDSRASTLLSKFYSGCRIGEMFSELIRCSERLEQIAARSYWHPNGFCRIPLWEGDAYGPKVRLHCWMEAPRESRVTEDVHSHFWDFCSLVLLGCIASETFLEVEDRSGDGMKMQKHSLQPELDGRFSLLSTGPRKLLSRGVRKLRGGDVYCLSHTALHRVARGSSELTATLVLHGPKVTDSNYVYSAAPVASNQMQSPRRASQATIQQILNVLCKSLG